MSARDDILRCARDIYLEEGLAGMSLRKVAACAGVSAPAIYRHFDSKEDLLWAVCEQGHELFARYLARGLKAPTALERLRQTGFGYLAFAMEHRHYYTIMFVAPPEHLGFDDLERQNANAGSVTFQMLVDRVRECIAAGVLRDDDPEALAIAIWAYVHGLVTLYYRVPSDPKLAQLAMPAVSTFERFEALYTSSLDALLAGLAPR
ncbi:MAG: TetR/AcrR family transcriptional regulator [Sandaracinaceae bacterium]